MDSVRRPTSLVWWGALGCFVLAGATGALLRFGFLYGFPGGLQFPNLLHAHSHLMYFGWVTPALIALVGTHLARLEGRTHARFNRIGLVVLGLALLAYLPFLLYGYQSVPVGRSRVPLATIAASLNILAWYVFVVRYVLVTQGYSRSFPMRLWDAGLAFLVLASFGAWGRAVLVVLRVEDPFWTTAFVHLFLDLFSDGWAAAQTWGEAVTPNKEWFVLAVIAVQASLLPLTGLWPSVLAGRWTFHVAAWAALLPVGVAVLMLGHGLSRLKVWEGGFERWREVT